MTEMIQIALPDAAIRRLDARILTAGAATAEIKLDDNIYTLRITKSGKLILTK